MSCERLESDFCLEDRYIVLAVPDTDIEVMVKLDNEGVVVDVLRGDDDPVASAWRFYEDMGLEVGIAGSDGEYV